MFRVLVSALAALARAWPVAAQNKPFPGSFRTQEITTDDAVTIHPWAQIRRLDASMCNGPLLERSGVREPERGKSPDIYRGL
jgi:hypothetical protein